MPVSPYLKRLRRIEGQVRGLQKMVEDDKYCIDILTRVPAATKALQSVALGLLDDHLAHCVTEAAAGGGEVSGDGRQRRAAVRRGGRGGPGRGRGLPARRVSHAGKSAGSDGVAAGRSESS
jgi:DNA-binding FrmR family transcriptional regulator